MNLEVIEDLVNIPSPSGREKDAINYLIERVKEINLDYYIDLKGNLIIGADNKKDFTLTFLSHIDEIAFVVTKICDYKVFFICLSKIDESVQIGQRVLFINGEIGVICKREDIFIDVSGTKGIEVGMFAVFYPFWKRQADYVFANGLDNKVGCGIIYNLLGKLSSYRNININCVFTVQEEVGARGAYLMADYKNSDVIIAVDATAITECYTNTSVGIGEGTAIKICDAGNIISNRMVEKLQKIAKDYKSHTQLEVVNRGSTDIRSVEELRKRSELAVVSVPCKYGHSACEMMKISDINDTYSFLVSICDYYDKQ